MHKSGFSAPDLLSILVIKYWVDELGGQVNQLSSYAGDLFALCSEAPWPRIEQSFLLHDLATRKWALVRCDEPLRLQRGAVVLPINELAAQLRGRLMGDPVEPQQPLEFPLMSVEGDGAAPAELASRRAK